MSVLGYCDVSLIWHVSFGNKLMPNMITHGAICSAKTKKRIRVQCKHLSPVAGLLILALPLTNQRAPPPPPHPWPPPGAVRHTGQLTWCRPHMCSCVPFQKSRHPLTPPPPGFKYPLGGKKSLKYCVFKKSKPTVDYWFCSFLRCVHSSPLFSILVWCQAV